MKSHICLSIVLLFAMLIDSQCLHMRAKDTPVDKQLALLKQQQVKFESNINSLIANVSKIEERIKNSDDTSEKVLILEKAIVSERQQIF